MGDLKAGTELGTAQPQLVYHHNHLIYHYDPIIYHHNSHIFHHLIYHPLPLVSVAGVYIHAMLIIT